MSFQSIDTSATTPPSSLSNINLSIDTTHSASTDANTDATVEANNAEANDTDAQAQDISILLKETKDKIIGQVKAQLLDEFKDLLKLQAVDKPLLIKILIRGMEIMETTTIKGTEQKDLVIDILIQILETDGINVSHKDLLIHFLKEDANAFIDVIVDASRGKININKVESVVTKCIQYLFICLKKK
jgi:hypothetical protein